MKILKPKPKEKIMRRVLICIAVALCTIAFASPAVAEEKTESATPAAADERAKPKVVIVVVVVEKESAWPGTQHPRNLPFEISVCDLIDCSVVRFNPHPGIGGCPDHRPGCLVDHWPFGSPQYEVYLPILKFDSDRVWNYGPALGFGVVPLPYTDFGIELHSDEVNSKKVAPWKL